MKLVSATLSLALLASLFTTPVLAEGEVTQVEVTEGEGLVTHEGEKPVFGESLANNLAANATDLVEGAEESKDADTVAPVAPPFETVPTVAPVPTSAPSFKEGDAPVAFAPDTVKQPVFMAPVAPPPISGAGRGAKTAAAALALVLASAAAGL